MQNCFLEMQLHNHFSVPIKVHQKQTNLSELDELEENLFKISLAQLQETWCFKIK